MKKLLGFIVVVLLLAYGRQTVAHFGMLIPSDNMVMQDENRTVNLQLSFSHPMEMVGMDLVKPKAVKVVTGGQQHDMLDALKSIRVMDNSAWGLDYQIKRPGVYNFYMEPQPYWEPVEDVFIIHYTKTVVTAFGNDEGWDKEIGLKTEIVPLSKPFGLYAGNVFQGIVKFDGKPVPYAEVEVEFYNKDKSAQAPTEYMVTQTIKADQNGVFTYAAPTAGW
jgi:cobalt/nickel transport protein